MLNVLRDGAVVPGAGAFEVAAHIQLQTLATSVKGCAQLGVLAYANALLVIPKTLVSNAGFSAQEKIVALIEETRGVGDAGVLGINLDSGEVELVNVSFAFYRHFSDCYYYRASGTTCASSAAASTPPTTSRPICSKWTKWFEEA